MTRDELIPALGYPSIFCRTPEKAADNLLRLIANHECGYVEERETWLAALRSLLEEGFNAEELNLCGAAFTEHQWQQTLLLLIQKLMV